MIRIIAVCLLAVSIAACGGGAGGDGGSDSGGCRGNCAPAAPAALSVAEVQRVLTQAALEAQARGAPATIAVVDRIGNVLGVFRMTGAAPTVTITSGRGVTGGLENVAVPSELAAIAKAMTGAYLSTEGNAFTTRTASQIIQENFNPGEANMPSGPLFGVQFSSLSCSDITRNSAVGTPGPKGSPLGLSADPGGLPLYKDGTVVGGVGVVANGTYTLDQNISDIDQDVDELTAVAATRGFEAPADRRADRIAVDGRLLRFVDMETTLTGGAALPAFATLPGALIPVAGYTAGPIAAGTPFATPASGIRPNTDPAFTGLNTFVLDDGAGGDRFAPRASTDGLLTQAEVTTILAEAVRVANRTRAQIRRPLGSAAQVTITVVDTNGAVVGLVRTPDAPVFGIDVSVQKARTALLFSSPTAAAELSAHPPAAYPGAPPIADYVARMQSLIPGALTDGTAYTSRTVGNLARPFFPDGINGNPPGPLSKPFNNWSPFNNGLQLDLVFNRLTMQTPPCTALARVPNGIQIFPGSVPIYRGNVLAGAVGVSGDGVDQDDLIAFLGLANAGRALGTGVSNAPPGRRADQIGGLPGGRLRYVNCPVAPFVDSPDTDVCNGL